MFVTLNCLEIQFAVQFTLHSLYCEYLLQRKNEWFLAKKVYLESNLESDTCSLEVENRVGWLDGALNGWNFRPEY